MNCLLRYLCVLLRSVRFVGLLPLLSFPNASLCCWGDRRRDLGAFLHLNGRFSVVHRSFFSTRRQCYGLHHLGQSDRGNLSGSGGVGSKIDALLLVSWVSGDGPQLSAMLFTVPSFWCPVACVRFTFGIGTHARSPFSTSGPW